MYLSFEIISTRNGLARREFRCPRCDRWPRPAKCEPSATRLVELFECQCGVQISYRTATTVRDRVD